MVQPVFFHGFHRIAAQASACVATIGSFDGVHLGHQMLLRSVIAEAQARGVPSVVILFEPQPYEYFSREAAPARLMRLREKVAALLAAGIGRVLCLKFDCQLRRLSALEFIEQVLVKRLKIEHLVIGDDFRFGCDRAGDFSLLKSTGERFHFTVCDSQTLTQAGERISSTRIRQLLEHDQLLEAAQLLGGHFSVSGRVVYGKQLGRQLGFPTVNIGLGRYRSPVRGVYAVRVTELGRVGRFQRGNVYRGVANVGVRPTVGGVEKPLLEVHLLKVSKNLYGEFLQVEFLHKIRSEKNFASLDDLRAQISKDRDRAHDLFSDADSDFERSS